MNSDTSLGAYRWDEAHGWLPTAPNGSCDSNTTFAMSVDNHGSVYGLTYNSCTDYRAWMWNPRQGSVQLASPAQKLDGTPANTRINQVSANGETLVGWMEDPLTGIWFGTVWNAGVPTLVLTSDGEPVDEVTAVSGDGSTMGVLGFGSSPSTMCKSVLQTPQAETFRRIWPGPGRAYGAGG